MAGNGSNAWLRWLVGAVFSVVVAVLMFMGKSVIANDKDSRARDQALDDKIHKAVEVQMVQNSTTNVALAEIKTMLKYLKQNGVN